MSHDLISSWDLQNKGVVQRKGTKTVKNARSNFFHQRNLIFDHIRYDWSFRWPHNMDYRFALFYPLRSLPRYLSSASALTVTRPEVCSGFWQQFLENTWIFFLQLSHSSKYLLNCKRHYKEQLVNNKRGKEHHIISAKLSTPQFPWLWNAIAML